ncbi:MAG TPA: UDP-N-acetylmuramoyl-L-alanine--D-glutamate ligase [Thermoanaerobaculia bacterium]|nr:UDP-N-acetylmuramoyl-L-alanine--D-glutamate ligase [Thermoanaerobaculia bacterium]
MGKVAVFGAAKSGVAAANVLAARGEAVIITDAKPENELPLVSSLDPRVERVLGGHPPALLDSVRLIVLSPGIPREIPILRDAAARAIPIISEVELAFRSLRGTVVAITGSNGKSTTTALVGEILKVAGRDPVVAGNIGEALVAHVDAVPRHYVVELSSFQLETVESFRANVAVLLNVTPDHLDRYASMEEYSAAKHRIFRNQTTTDFAVVNADDPRTARPATAARVLAFSSRRRLDEGAFLEGESLVMRLGGEQRSIPRGALRLPGTPNVENALAAWLAARALGVSELDVQIAFGSFEGLPHRMALVRDSGGVRWINDSKGTNVDASLKSLEGMEDRRTILILGGKDKKGEFERLRPLVEVKAKAVLTIGAAAERIGQALAGAAEIVPAETMERAVLWAHEHAAAGDTVLLSPACASFDQYENFEQRGCHFEQLVGALEDRR